MESREETLSRSTLERVGTAAAGIALALGAIGVGYKIVETSVQDSMGQLPPVIDVNPMPNSNIIEE